MARKGIKRRTSVSGGGTGICTVGATGVLVIGLSVLGSPVAGIIASAFFGCMLKRGTRKQMEKKFLSQADRIATSRFANGEDNVVITYKDWSNATMPLPRKLTVHYER